MNAPPTKPRRARRWPWVGTTRRASWSSIHACAVRIVFLLAATYAVLAPQSTVYLGSWSLALTLSPSGKRWGQVRCADGTLAGRVYSPAGAADRLVSRIDVTRRTVRWAKIPVPPIYTKTLEFEEVRAVSPLEFWSLLFGL